MLGNATMMRKHSSIPIPFMSPEKLSPSAELKSVHELYELQSSLDLAIKEDRWTPKQKETIQEQQRELARLIRIAEEKKLADNVMGGEEVLDGIRKTHDVIKMRLSGDRNWKTVLNEEPAMTDEGDVEMKKAA
jgi:hypothetical protein